ncbi:nucleotidyltransferase family protein [Hyphobacterium sp. CCMP332]|nr:nucleotidyltransferase family protein [Hyphobacterium sp. CCMP332]
MLPKVHFLLLAAGASIRMGRIKQLLPWQKTSLLEHALKEALNSKVNRVSLVLGANAETILERTDTSKANVLININWKIGIGSSIAYGIGEILKKNPPDALLISLADQPFVNTEYYDQMIAHYDSDEKTIVASQYEDNIGTPALFGSAYFKSLCDLKGDEGAKSLILKFKDHLITLDGSEIHRDIDTMQDYYEAIENIKKRE